MAHLLIDISQFVEQVKKTEIMKRNILHIILVLAIAIVTPNVYADGTKGDKEKKTTKERSEKVIDRINATFESELELENWMIDSQEFASRELFYEEDLKMESWMVNANAFKAENISLEPEMELENWMTESFEIEEFEMEMELEDWMLKPFASNDDFQEEELELEDWMLKF